MGSWFDMHGRKETRKKEIPQTLVSRPQQQARTHIFGRSELFFRPHYEKDDISPFSLFVIRVTFEGIHRGGPQRDTGKAIRIKNRWRGGGQETITPGFRERSRYFLYAVWMRGRNKTFFFLTCTSLVYCDGMLTWMCISKACNKYNYSDCKAKH